MTRSRKKGCKQIFNAYFFFKLFLVSQGQAEYKLDTNIPPQGGSCDVTPKTGEELDTIFIFSCSGWQDEHQPLTYEMFYFHPNKSEEHPVSPLNGVLFFFGPSLESYRAILPMGKIENNYSVNVTVIIRDAYGEYVDKNLQIQVKPAFNTDDAVDRRSLDF